MLRLFGVASSKPISRAIDATVTYLDEAIGHEVSARWNRIDQRTRDQIAGTGKIVSVFVPGGSVKAIRGLKEARTRNAATNVVPDNVYFGRNANQDYHVWRHVEDELGMSRLRVQDAVVADLPPVAGLSDGLNVRFVTVDGVRLQYNVFKLPDGTVNIGRIHEAN